MPEQKKKSSEASSTGKTAGSGRPSIEIDIHDESVPDSKKKPGAAADKKDSQQ